MALAPTDDGELVERILAGDRAALRRLVEREHAALLRLAKTIVRQRERAEDVVQDAWVAILRSLGGFERRSSLRTWMARIVVNRAKTVGQREARWIPFSAEAEQPDEAIDPSAFGPRGFWESAPGKWSDATPDKLLAEQRVRAIIEAELATLPPGQRAVLTLRDLEGWDAQEVCNALEITESNQRVLLHRARCRLRDALAKILGAEASVVS